MEDTNNRIINIQINKLKQNTEDFEFEEGDVENDINFQGKNKIIDAKIDDPNLNEIYHKEEKIEETFEFTEIENTEILKNKEIILAPQDEIQDFEFEEIEEEPNIIANKQDKNEEDFVFDEIVEEITEKPSISFIKEGSLFYQTLKKYSNAISPICLHVKNASYLEEKFISNLRNKISTDTSINSISSYEVTPLSEFNNFSDEKNIYVKDNKAKIRTNPITYKEILEGEKRDHNSIVPLDILNKVPNNTIKKLFYCYIDLESNKYKSNFPSSKNDLDELDEKVNLSKKIYKKLTKNTSVSNDHPLLINENINIDDSIKPKKMFFDEGLLSLMNPEINNIKVIKEEPQIKEIEVDQNNKNDLLMSMLKNMGLSDVKNDYLIESGKDLIQNKIDEFNSLINTMPKTSYLNNKFIEYPDSFWGI